MAFAPFGIWPLAIVAPALLFWLWQDAAPRRAAALGFAFGSGTFAAGTYWLYISIHGFGKAPVWLALLLMAALVMLMASYTAVLGYVAARWLPANGPSRWLLGLPGAWVLLEWVRGWLFSGFGWLSLGYSQTDTWLAAWAPLGGMHLLSWLLLMMAGALVMWRCDRPRRTTLALVVLIVPWLLGLLLARIEWTRPAGAPVAVAIVQGAVPQDQKWLADNRERTLQRYRDLTLSALGTPLIVWPEAAAPELANNIVPYLNKLGEEASARNSALLLGLIRAEPARPDSAAARAGEVEYFNSLLAFSSEVAWYDKRHLVPFGEFFPVPDVVRRWMRLMSLPYSDFTRGAADQGPLRIAGLALSASICYEDAYATAQLSAVRDSTALVNVTNDAWFGRSTARHQHLQISRMRAVEAQRFMIRAANDGISAVIGPRGEFIARAPDFETTVLKAEVVPRAGIPPYAAAGNLPLLALAGLSLLFALWRAGRRRELPAEPRV